MPTSTFFTSTNQNPSPDYNRVINDLFNPPSQRSPSNDDVISSFGQFNQSFNYAVAASVVISILGMVAVVVLVFFIINCLRNTLIPVTQQYLTNKGALPKTSSQWLPVPTSDLEMGTMERFIHNIDKEKPTRFSPQLLMEFTNNYSTMLGSGGFGIVYKGELPNGTPVAVKVLSESFDKRAEEQFMAEVGTISRTYHINLVRLYGFCFDESVKALVYEYMENGSLDRILFDETNKFEWAKLHDIAIGTAKGIAYLHEECQQKIIHYDIKPGNILLDAEFKPKVADFGLAKLLDRGDTRMALSRMRGTPGYAAPELWLPYPVTSKCDVYSFGVLLFEILGRRRNLDFNVTESREWFPRWVWEKYEKGDVDDMLRVCEIDEQEREKAERMCMVALWCAQHEPEGRPHMSKVVKMLEGGVEIAAPSNPFQHMMSGKVDGTNSSYEDSSSGSAWSAPGLMAATPSGNHSNLRRTLTR